MKEIETRWVVVRTNADGTRHFHGGGTGVFVRKMSLIDAHKYRSAGMAERIVRELNGWRATHTLSVRRVAITAELESDLV